MKYIITILLFFLNPALVPAQETKHKNHFLGGFSAGKNFIQDHPGCGFIYGGYEYILTPKTEGYFIALEGRIKSGLILGSSWLLETNRFRYSDMVLGGTLLPRAYLEVCDDGFIYIEGEIGTAYHYATVKTSSTSRTQGYTPLYGVKIGIKHKNISLWGGYTGIDSERIINKATSVEIKGNLDGEAGFSFYF
jgi:hypothetical protein